MADVKWIKITTSIFDDEKIKLIESMPSCDSILVIWFKLLVLAGKSNKNGALMLNTKVSYNLEMLSSIFSRDLATIRLAISTFERFEMIEIAEDVITIPNWEKHQNVDGLNKIKEQNRIRKQKQREIIKLNTPKSHVTGHVTVTQSHATDIDIDIELDKDIDIYKYNNGHSTPKLKEIEDYGKSRNSNVDPVKFFNYYESIGWISGKGKTPIIDWKAKFRYWEKNDNTTENKQMHPKNGRNKLSYEKERKYTEEELEEMLVNNNQNKRG